MAVTTVSANFQVGYTLPDDSPYHELDPTERLTLKKALQAARNDMLSVPQVVQLSVDDTTRHADNDTLRATLNSAIQGIAGTLRAGKQLSGGVTYVYRNGVWICIHEFQLLEQQAGVWLPAQHTEPSSLGPVAVTYFVSLDWPAV